MRVGAIRSARPEGLRPHASAEPQFSTDALPVPTPAGVAREAQCVKHHPAKPRVGEKQRHIGTWKSQNIGSHVELRLVCRSSAFIFDYSERCLETQLANGVPGLLCRLKIEDGRWQMADGRREL